MKSDREVTDDGYEVVEPRRGWDGTPIVGVKCGLCGSKFDYGKAYGYSCPNGGCPLGYNR